MTKGMTAVEQCITDWETAYEPSMMLKYAFEGAKLDDWLATRDASKREQSIKKGFVNAFYSTDLSKTISGFEKAKKEFSRLPGYEKLASQLDASCWN